MKGVTFGDIHTSTFGIYLSSVTIGEAAVKKYQLDIPGASGSLDMTEFFGSVSYKNRTITFEFAFPQRNEKLLAVYSEFQQAVHGKELSIILDDDREYHYIGRISVGDLKKSTVSSVLVKCDCHPFRYSNTPNVVEIAVEDVEFPGDWLYGDVNDSGTVTSVDLNAVKTMVGKRTYESRTALRSDFDFDGIVTESEVKILQSYLESGSVLEFKDYVFLNPTIIEMRNCKRIEVDFGRIPVDVTFSVKDITNTRLWEVRVDNIPLGSHISGQQSYTVKHSGKHEIMIVTANTDTTGVFEISWYDATKL